MRNLLLKTLNAGSSGIEIKIYYFYFSHSKNKWNGRLWKDILFLKDILQCLFSSVSFSYISLKISFETRMILLKKVLMPFPEHMSKAYFSGIPLKNLFLKDSVCFSFLYYKIREMNKILVEGINYTVLCT